jgi:hypothetical protein
LVEQVLVYRRRLEKRRPFFGGKLTGAIRQKQGIGIESVH